ncbi:MAG: hypothetical protein ACM3QX_12940 [Syntrophomonadaceae bacterium]
METVSTVYDELKIRKAQKLFLNSTGYNCFKASDEEPAFAIIDNLQSQLIHSNDFNKELIINSAKAISSQQYIYDLKCSGKTLRNSYASKMAQIYVLKIGGSIN